MAMFGEPFTAALALPWTMVRGTGAALTVNTADNSGIINTTSNAAARCDGGATGSANMFAECDVVAAGADANRSIFVHARFSGSGTFNATANTSYALTINAQAGTWALLWYSDTAATAIIATTAITLPAAPFKIRIECQGSTIRAYIGGALVGTVTDTKIPTGQFGGIGFFNGGTVARVDNFRVGTLTDPGTFFPFLA